MPPLTAFVVCYNHARFVVQALESVRIQGYPNTQLIIADDCSTDGSPDLIRSWMKVHWPQATFIAHERNTGVCRTLNDVFSKAEGKYLSGLAADDMWLPGKLVSQVQALEQLPRKVGVLYADAHFIDQDGKRLPGSFIASHRKFSRPPEGDLSEILWEGNFIPSPATLVRRECYERAGAFDECLCYEDWDMWLRIAQEFHFAFRDDVRVHYRVVQTSMVRSRMHLMVDSTCDMCLKHLRSGKLSPAARRRAAAALNHHARASFHLQSAHHRRNLFNSVGNGISWKSAVLLILSCLGLSSRKLRRLSRRPIQTTSTHPRSSKLHGDEQSCS